jgi:hypothetical protein
VQPNQGSVSAKYYLCCSELYFYSYSKHIIKAYLFLQVGVLGQSLRTRIFAHFSLGIFANFALGIFAHVAL